MKKTPLTIVVILAALVLGGTQAYAVVPVINGLLGAGADISEWAPSPSYEYYLRVDDPNELGVGDKYDIKTGILLQELGNGDASKDGVYFMLTTWATPPSLLDVDHLSTRSSVALLADFDGDSIPSDPFGPFPGDIQLYITNLNTVSPGPIFSDPTLTDKVFYCTGAVGSCDSLNGTLIWSAGGPTGDTPAGFLYARGADAFEFFLKTGTFGTPANTPLPFTLKGTATYDDGTVNPDDIAMGRLLIPEPSTMLLLGGAFLGLLGFGGIRRFKYSKV